MVFFSSFLPNKSFHKASNSNGTDEFKSEDLTIAFPAAAPVGIGWRCSQSSVLYQGQTGELHAWLLQFHMQRARGMAQALPLLQRKPISISSCLRKPRCAAVLCVGYIHFFPHALRYSVSTSVLFQNTVREMQPPVTSLCRSLHRWKETLGKRQPMHKTKCLGAPTPSPQGQQMLQGPTRATREAEANAF